MDISRIILIAFWKFGFLVNKLERISFLKMFQNSHTSVTKDWISNKTIGYLLVGYRVMENICWIDIKKICKLETRNLCLIYFNELWKVFVPGTIRDLKKDTKTEERVKSTSWLSIQNKKQ